MFTFQNITQAEPYLVQTLSSPRFLDSARDFSGSSSFVAPYPPAQERAAREVVSALVGDLAVRGVGARSLDVFRETVDILDEQGFWEPLVEMEPTMEPAALRDLLMDAADIDGTLVPRIAAAAREPGTQVLIVCGIGACYPFLRAHRLLARLDAPVPVLVMFPGTHHRRPDGSSTLDVLDTPAGTGASHYRARNIFEF